MMTMFVRLSPNVSVKMLEEPCLYDRVTDELYIVGEEALGLVVESIAGIERPMAGEAAEFVDYCLEEGLMAAAGPAGRTGEPAGLEPGLSAQAPPGPASATGTPSLRYLLMHVTGRCNLTCRHCFQGATTGAELSTDQIGAVIEDFERVQGLRLIVSGGEPLLHPGFWEMNEMVAAAGVRSILLSNGTLIDTRTARRLRFHEVQVSLDGLESSHDFIRGRGSFERALGGISALTAAGVPVSIATMAHSGNRDEFDELGALVRRLGAQAWSIDVPSVSGRMTENTKLVPDPSRAGPLLDLAFGGAVHDPVPGYACGSHLMAVTARGEVARCGFFADKPVGTIAEGLSACWQKIDKTRLDELKCSCHLVAECRGGCRFRARGYNSATGPDLCQCFRHGVL